MSQNGIMTRGDVHKLVHAQLWSVRHVERSEQLERWGQCSLRYPPTAKLNPGRHSRGGVVDSFGQIGGWDPGEPDRPMRGVRSRPVNGREHISQCRLYQN